MNQKNDCVSRLGAIISIFQEADKLENNGAIPMGQGARAMAFVVDALPPAELEHKKGKWIEIKYTFHHKCSNCEWINNADSGYNFLPKLRSRYKR